MPSSMDYVMQAEEAERANSPEEARTYAIKALNEDDTNVDALIVLARVTNDSDERRQALARAAELAPNHPHLPTVSKPVQTSDANWESAMRQMQSEMSADDAAKFEKSIQTLKGVFDSDPRKRKVEDVVSYDLGTNYLLISVGLLLAYWFFYPVGFIGNLWAMRRARGQDDAQYTGCLYAVFITHGVPALCFCALMIATLLSGGGDFNITID